MLSFEEAVQRFEKKAASESHAFLVPLECDAVEAEEKLGIAFPPSYSRFLQKGAKTSITGGDIVDENRSAHEGKTYFLPVFLTAFYEDGMGNQYCFDSRTQDADGEYPIVFWDHELSTEEKLAKITVTDESFDKWLRRSAEEIRLDDGAFGFGGTVFAAGCLLIFGLLIFLATVGVTTIVKWLR